MRAPFHTVTGTENDDRGNGRRKADRDGETCTERGHTCNTNAVLRDALFPLVRPFAHVVCANKNDPVANGRNGYIIVIMRDIINTTCAVICVRVYI